MQLTNNQLFLLDTKVALIGEKIRSRFPGIFTKFYLGIKITMHPNKKLIRAFENKITETINRAWGNRV